MDTNGHERAAPAMSIWLRKHRVKLLLLVMVLLIPPVAALLVADRVCRAAAAGRIFRSAENIPSNDIALVLGTGKFTAQGHTNLHFTRRIRAAAELYHAGKVRHLIVSGDNHIKSYDEPTDMREALAAAGVPTNAITCDYAGFRTLDSVVRANSVFGQTNFTIVTEEFHCPRALWIAEAHGLNAVAFAAPDLSLRWSARVRAREALARVLCGLDLYVFRTQPKFPGPPEPILASKVRGNR
jgi:SanA protein